MDATKLFSLLNQQVHVRTSRRTHSGELVCVDPVSLLVVLYDRANQQMSMLLHHAITSIEPSSEQPQSDLHNVDFKQICDNFFGHPLTSSAAAVSEQSLVEQQQRRSRVLDLLHENNVPVEEQDELLIAAYSVAIYPPYTEADCKSSNAIILGRIQTII